MLILLPFEVYTGNLDENVESTISKFAEDTKVVVLYSEDGYEMQHKS